MHVSVVVATYEWPQALDAVLRALSEQPGQDFDVVVADDGSGPATADVVRHWDTVFGPRLQHIWQPDDGFRRARALNLGARAARGDYLVFMDGDCLPRLGFLGAVRRAALPGWFLGSKRLHLSSRLSSRVLEGRAQVWRWSALRWLAGSPREFLDAPRETGRPGVLLPVRDRRRPWRPQHPDFVPPFEAYGFFLGVHRADFERVNGFEMRFVQWGGEDADVVVRLRRSGLRCGWPGPKATLLHLWHPDPAGMPSESWHLLGELDADTRIEAVQGLRELGAELGSGRRGGSAAHTELEDLGAPGGAGDSGTPLAEPPRAGVGGDQESA